MALVSVELSDYVDEISDRELIRELQLRLERGHITLEQLIDPLGPEPWTRAGIAADIRETFYRRDASRLEALLKVLESREEP